MSLLTSATRARIAISVCAPALASALALALAACTKQPERMPDACVGDQASLLAALRRAPAPVTLPGGTRLSHCIGTARSDADLQSLGLVLTRLADTLRRQARADPGAAVRLGYLAGAVRTGAASTHSGIAAQLARRIEQLATLDDGAGAAARAAQARGVAAGERSG